MRGFRSRATVEQVWALLDERISVLSEEEVALGEAYDRVLAADLVSARDVPLFDRAAMDGYALRGEETQGADGYAPAVFRRIGEARPGRAFGGRIGPGQAVEIATGAPLPEGADTVVPVEVTSRAGDQIQVFEAVPPGRHVSRRGEDLVAGSIVLRAGRVLRPQDLGVLSGLGLEAIRVVRRPVVTILVTGDELLPPGTPPSGHRFADMNGPMLSALVQRDGGLPRQIGPVGDDREALGSVLLDAVRDADLVLISGGSSTGPEDHAPALVAELGELPIHGVAVRPASPTGIGFVDSVPVVLLPGNPVSSLCAYDLFAGRLIRRLGGRGVAMPYRRVERPLARKLVSAVGRVDYARVGLVAGQVEPLAIAGASILSSVTRADGFVLVPADLEGYPAGALVQVWLYDRDPVES
jgi:molybdopterin molybdotransferase